MKKTEQSICLMWIDSFLGLEYKHKQNLLSNIRNGISLQDFAKSSKDYLVKNLGEGVARSILNSATQDYVEYLLSELNRRKVNFITIFDEEYPESLRNIPVPPLVVYYQGDITLLKDQAFAIVGSRKSLPLSISLAKEYTEHLVKCGLTIVTGIAEGVDKTVLETALAKKGKIISVVAGGLDNLYPKQHQTLINEVAKVGLVISEYPPETNTKPFHFPVRNRIISALSKGVLIVSGAKKSGTLYTAEYAEEYGKDVFAIPYSVNVESGAGCNELIKLGAILTNTPSDISEFYKISVKEEVKLLTTEETEIVKVLKQGNMHVEKIAQDLSKKVYEITPKLSCLEIKGVVIKQGVNVYGLSRTYVEE